MKTYAEVSGEQPFDWNQWLDDAIKCDPDSISHAEAKDRAEDWTTCACGNQCADLPRKSDGRPKDDNLMMLGLSFVDFITDGSWGLAKRTLAAIEARSSFLLAQMEAAK